MVVSHVVAKTQEKNTHDKSWEITLKSQKTVCSEIIDLSQDKTDEYV